jgi:hypothetical protein
MIRRILGIILGTLVVLTVIMAYSVKIPRPEAPLTKEIPFEKLPR